MEDCRGAGSGRRLRPERRQRLWGKWGTNGRENMMGLELGGAQPLLHNLSSFQPFNETEKWIMATTFYSFTKHKKWLSLTRWLGISSSPKGYPLNQIAPYTLAAHAVVSRLQTISTTNALAIQTEHQRSGN
jgi:hypothetical protein